MPFLSDHSGRPQQIFCLMLSGRRACRPGLDHKALSQVQLVGASHAGDGAKGWCSRQVANVASICLLLAACMTLLPCEAGYRNKRCCIVVMLLTGNPISCYLKCRCLLAHCSHCCYQHHPAALGWSQGSIWLPHPQRKGTACAAQPRQMQDGRAGYEPPPPKACAPVHMHLQIKHWPY